MDKYLRELLLEIKTIIIPGVGALTLIDRENNEIMFMPYLRHDDGTLAAFIAEREQMELNDAKNLVSKYSREIIAQLDKGESYDMFQFGSFTKENDGEIQFKTWPSDLSMNEKTDPIEPIASVVIETETTVSELEIDKNESLSRMENESEENDLKQAVQDSNDDQMEDDLSVNNPSEELQKESKQPQTNQREFNILEKEEQAATKAKLEALRERKANPKSTKKKKGVGFYSLLILIIVVVGVSGYVIYDYNNLIQPSESEDIAEKSELDSTGNKNLENEQKENAEKNEISQTMTEENSEPIMEETPAQEESVDEVKQVPVTNSNGRYHIIAGSFASESNASKFVSQLNASGTNASIIQSKALFRISLGSYGTRAEAKEALSKINYSGKALVSFVD